MPGSANIAFAWDSSDAMNIEYRIPLSFLGTLSSDPKKISIGWKIKGAQFSSNHDGSDQSSGEGRHGGGHSGGGGKGYGGGGYGSHGEAGHEQSHENMMNEESVWTRYTFRD